MLIRGQVAGRGTVMGTGDRCGNGDGKWGRGQRRGQGDGAAQGLEDGGQGQGQGTGQRHQGHRAHPPTASSRTVALALRGERTSPRGGPQPGRGPWPGEGVPAGVPQPRPWHPQTCSGGGPEQGAVPPSPLSPPRSAVCVPWSCACPCTHGCPVKPSVSQGAVDIPWSCTRPVEASVSHGPVDVPWNHTCPLELWVAHGAVDGPLCWFWLGES